MPLPPGGRAVNPWWIGLTLTIATFMELLDTSIANVSLRHIAGGLGTSPDEAAVLALPLPTPCWPSAPSSIKALAQHLTPDNWAYHEWLQQVAGAFRHAGYSGIEAVIKNFRTPEKQAPAH